MEYFKKIVVLFVTASFIALLIVLAFHSLNNPTHDRMAIHRKYTDILLKLGAMYDKDDASIAFPLGALQRLSISIAKGSVYLNELGGEYRIGVIDNMKDDIIYVSPTPEIKKLMIIYVDASEPRGAILHHLAVLPDDMLNALFK